MTLVTCLSLFKLKANFVNVYLQKHEMLLFTLVNVAALRKGIQMYKGDPLELPRNVFVMGTILEELCVRLEYKTLDTFKSAILLF